VQTTAREWSPDWHIPFGVSTAAPAPVLSADVGISGPSSATVTRTSETYNLAFVVRNAGPESAPGVTVSVSPSAGLSVDSVSAGRGSCLPTSCSLGTFVPGEETTVTVGGRRPPPGRYELTVGVGADRSDPDTSNQRLVVVVDAGAAAAAPAPHAAVLSGTAGPDRLLGTSANDVLSGGPGNDVLDGGPGADVLYGGTGDDVLAGGAGPDQLNGNAGNDRIFAVDGQPDVIRCGPGRDAVRADAGLDRIDGGCEAVTLVRRELTKVG
jgi:RTX calcium-binding nonapeptide repeat (4 copies)/Domain of unknown function DUF11